MKKNWKILGLIFIILLCGGVLAAILYVMGDDLGYVTFGQRVAIWLQSLLLILVLLFTPIIITSSSFLWAKDKSKQESLNPSETKKAEEPKPYSEFTDMVAHCRYHHGFFWRYKIRKILVTGRQQDVDKVLPTLTHKTWLVGNNVLLIWGGEIQAPINLDWFKMVKRYLSRLWILNYKPVNATVWILPSDYTAEQHKKIHTLEHSLLQIRKQNQALGWDIPLYLVENKQLNWQQDGRTEQSIGVCFDGNKKHNIDKIVTALTHLTTQCTEVGMQQVMQHNNHAFLLELSQYLEQKQIPLLKNWFTRFFAQPYCPVLRGLFFSSFYQINNNYRASGSDTDIDVSFQLSPLWMKIIADNQKAKNKRIGISLGTIFCCVILFATVLTVIGLCTSFIHNRKLINQSLQVVDQINKNTTSRYVQRLEAQYQLQLLIGKLEYRQQKLPPLTYRFGLSQNDKLYRALWQKYYKTNQENVIKPLNLWLNSQLTRIVYTPTNKSKYSKLINNGYDILKTYLMLGYPDKADGHYLGQFVTQHWKHGNDITDGDWQRLMPELITFWGNRLKKQPEWKEPISQELIRDVRQVLINQIGLQNAENTIYQGIIQRASQRFTDLSLINLLNGVDSRALFTANKVIPGVYTRQAWEDMIEREIKQASKSRQEQIDWVLSDGSETALVSISPEVLKKRLTDRYFADYGAAWLLFLNNIQWNSVDTISDVIEQLSLLSDNRQSPLLALIGVIKYHAEVAYHRDGFSRELIRSAQELVKSRDVPNLLKNSNEATGPLTPTFGPILDLLKSDNNNELSLQTYLMRVIQVKLKLQNIVSSPNPQAMAQQLAKSVFQGTSVDLTATRDYGNLIAANLGEEWSGFGYSIFKRPLEQAWQVILTPAAKSFNDTWREAIVYSWEKSFAGRYPFKNTDNDASLAELSRFIRPDSGVIDRFIQSELTGILIKKGDKWVIDSVNSEGLNFTHEFLNTLELFNQLANQVFESGDAKIEFDLMARSGHNIVQSELVINKQKLAYFNQMPAWKRMHWPDNDYSAYAQLSWNTEETGLKLYQYYSGDWAWIRLLESAEIRQIDNSRFELKWQVEPNKKLKYILRTQSGSGPINLLKLRNFQLPKSVFEINF
jgi:type VI secretion system protein ImpL